MTSSADEFDAIVIGAGVSGLTAAYRLLLLNPNYRILVLEAKDRVGGRTEMVPLKVANNETANFDLGGMWVGPTQRNISELLKELQIDIYPQFLSGRKIAEMGRKVAQYSGDIPYIGMLGLLDMGKIIFQLERYVRQVDPDDAAKSKFADYYDSVSGRALINSISWNANSKCLISAASRTIWGADLEQMSALYMLAYAKSAGSFEALVASDEKSGQGFKMKGGAQQVSLRLAEKLGDDRLLLNSPVVAIDQTEESRVLVTIKGREQPLAAKAVICAVPPHLLQGVDFQPPLPAKKAELCKFSPVGHLFKFVITYETAFWRELGFSGEIVSADGPPTVRGCSSAPISTCFDYSVNDDRHPALVVLSGGLQARELDELTADQRKAAVLGHLARFFPKEKVLACLDFAEKNWRSEPYNGGCPVDVTTTGAARLLGPSQRQPFGRVHFAGTETATEWRGFIDGAVQAGERAAKEIQLLLSQELLAEEATS